jgi:phosphoribosylformimino-5-aminoimidazole carboxamide ribotide isomerase
MIAIPAIDLIDGKVVRLFQGNYDQQKNYEVNVLDYALEIAESGLEYLHLVDLSGAKIGQLVHNKIAEKIANQTNLKLDFGGGINKEEDLIELFEKGINQVVIGSLAVKNPLLVNEWMAKYGSERFILALDTDGENIKVKGWQEDSGLNFDQVLSAFSEYDSLTILCTDIRRDGTGKGPSVVLYKDLIQRYPQHKFIASGGVESINDLNELRSISCYACVIGKALLDGKISLTELKNFNDGRV